MQGLQRNSHLLSSNQCQTQDMLERQHSPVSSAFTLGVAIEMTLPAWFKLDSVQQCCKQVLMQRLQRNSHLLSSNQCQTEYMLAGKSLVACMLLKTYMPAICLHNVKICLMPA